MIADQTRLLIKLLWLFIFLSFNSPAYSEKLNKKVERVRVSILSTSPGSELYTLFGHAAIRIVDSSQLLDEVYGYGGFDFSTPNFYPEFVRGTLLYTITQEPYAMFREEFLSEPYQMAEQVLNLSPEQSSKIYQLLQENSLPKNRLYRYDFFYDNCSTRIRDILCKALPNLVLFSKQVNSHSPSYRDLLKPYLYDSPWVLLGTDLILGTPADKRSSPFGQTFLPFSLRTYLDQAKLADNTLLVRFSHLLINPKIEPKERSSITPIGVFWFVFLLSLLSFMNKRSERVFSSLVFVLYSLLGVLILFLWFGTERTSFGLNYNLFWASPLLITFLSPNLEAKKYIGLTSLALLGALFIIISLKVQIFNPAVLPLILILVPHLLRKTGALDSPIKKSQ
jgi:hypothetical protein